MDKVQLLGLFPEELTALLKEKGLPAFRGKQVFEWLHRGADFDQMTNLSKPLREELKSWAVAQPVKIHSHKQSQLDGTVKFLFELTDGNCVEGVLMHYHHGHTLCLSTQVGCRMGCAFCASTLDGCIRDLTAAEMLGQIQCANSFMPEGERVHNLVLMGSGEPLDNYDNVMRFIRLANHPQGLNLSQRGISLSTCGLVPQMYRLADEGLSVTLCLSLHAPNDEIRRQTMPIAKRYSMDEVLDACRNYVKKTGRRVIFEYALVSGVNSLPCHAQELAGKLRGLQCHVNLIPLNEVKERGLKGVNEKIIRDFMQELEKRNISCTRRREMGDDIDGACGQLRRKVLMQEKEAQP